MLYDSYGDGMCCANGVGAVLVQDANGTLIFEGDPINLQNFSELDESFSTGAATGPAWECSPFHFSFFHNIAHNSVIFFPLRKNSTAKML